MSSQRGPQLVGKSKLTYCVIAVAFALLGLSPVYADTVLVDPTDFTGTRTSGEGGDITASGNWDNGGFKLSWKIKEEDDGIFEYEYEIEGLEDEDVNYWILQLAPISGDWTGVFDESAEVGWFTPEGIDLFGVKFKEGTLEVEFESEYAPIWGSFYAADGDGLYAYNTGFGSDIDVTNLTNWIAVDGYSSVPEPSTLILLLTGTGFLAGAARFKRKFK